MMGGPGMQGMVRPGQFATVCLPPILQTPLRLCLCQRQRQSLSTTSLCAATTPPLHNFGLNFQCVGLVLSFLSPLALVFC